MKSFPLSGAFALLAAIPTTALGLSQVERTAYVLQLTAPEENQVRSCANRALQLNLALTSLLVAEASDKEVEESLLASAPTEGIKADRLRASALWKQTHSPAKVAEMTFFDCAKEVNLKLHPDPLISACFSRAGVPALADVLKMAGRTKEYTAAKVAEAYNKQIPETAVRAMVDQVYVHDVNIDNFEAHRQVMGECIRDAPSLVSDEDVLKEYERYKASMSGKEYYVFHILVGDKEKADAILARIKNGEPFAALAKAYSLDPGSKYKGGDLEWAQPSWFPPAFAKALAATAPGSYAPAPIQTQYGWHILKVDAVRPTKVAPFDQIKEKIRENLEATKIKAAQ